MGVDKVYPLGAHPCDHELVADETHGHGDPLGDRRPDLFEHHRARFRENAAATARRA